MMPAADPALLTDLQARGVSVDGDRDSAGGRRGGAGPSDHRALSVGDATVMVPMRAAGPSPYRLQVVGGETSGGPARGLLLRDDQPIAEVGLPAAPRFYALRTADGIPYSHIALLHARGVLASTVMQSCVRYNDAGQGLPLLRHRDLAGRGAHAAA